MYTFRVAQRAFLLPLLGIFLIPFIVSADVVIYTSGSADAGLTGDATQAFTIRDATVGGGITADANGGLTSILETAGEHSPPPQGPHSIVLSLENLFSSTQGSNIASGADINRATLWLHLNGIDGSPTSITLRGLSPVASDWVEAESSYNNKDAAGTGWDGSGGDFSTALTVDYGTFGVIPGGTSWAPFDITAALKDYKDGTIGGLVFTASAGTGFGDGFAVDSKDSSSGNSAVLRVDQIPEPAVASFMLIGSAAFYVSRRMKRSEAEAEMAAV